MLTQLALLSRVRPPKKSEGSNFFQLLQLDLQGSSLASECLCSARALTLIPARQFPWETLPRTKGGEGLLSVALSLRKAGVQLIAAAQVLDACGCIGTIGPSYMCKLRYLVTDPLISLSSSWRLLRHTNRVATVVLGLQGH